DTAPSFSPDGARICFESDRGGRQQIYVMASNGGQAQRISFGDGAYSTPVWSPRGDYIAFTKQAQGRFAIGIMRPDGSGERILTDGYHNEGPTWSPNGRVVMLFRDPGGRRARLVGALTLALATAACARTADTTGTIGAAQPGSQQDFVVNAGDRVFFESDRSELTAQSIATLEKQARWLQNYGQYAF